MADLKKLAEERRKQKILDQEAKKAVVGEKYDPMDDPDFDPIEAEKNRGVSGKNNPKGGKKLKKLTKEDKAFDNVVRALRKKHGESGVLTKDSPKPKSKPLDAKQIWRKDDRDAVQREVDAQYGRTTWNKKGSLGT